MQKVIIDTNFFLMPLRFGIDIFEQIQHKVGQEAIFFIMQGSMSELKKLLEAPKEADRKAARFGLKLLKAKGLKTLAHPLDLDVDSAIVDLAGNDYIVATQDMELRKKLKQRGVKVIYLRQKKYISMD